MIGLKHILGGFAAASLLASCGSNEGNGSEFRFAKTAITQAIQARRDAKAGVQPAPLTRESLAQYQTPMQKGFLPSLNMTAYFVPYGQNGDVETWFSSDKKSVSFRQGVMVATRGFGPDLMQSVAPGIGTIASGSGSYDRVYFYLDGADQVVRREYRCELANLGPETVTVVDRQHSTRHVTETCSGKGPGFTNDYWFENGTFLRKSNQLLVSEWGPIQFERVIDSR